MPEVTGTVKKMSPSGKGFLLNEFENWWNFGKGYDGPRPFAEGAAITVTYEESVRQDGTSSFFVLSAWPTTGQAGPVPPPVTPAGPKPSGPQPTAQPASYDEYRAAGPVPTPPSRENSILFQVCLKAAQEWVLATTAEGSPQRVSGEVLSVADTYYHEGLSLISGQPDKPADGDPGPTEEAA
jgi:hypothetical protein